MASVEASREAQALNSTAPETQIAQTQPAASVPAVAEEGEDEELIADDDVDSSYGESIGSETTSIASIYKGYFENGRRYQNVRNEEYFMPTDDKQWESMSYGHMLMLVLESKRANPLFRSPISAEAQHVLDLGTGSGEWALDVADRFPQLTVHAVDLLPANVTLTAPNCIFEVDDLTKPWTWNHKFDLVHMRHMLGAFSDADSDKMYQRVYHNLNPGGWIEEVEWDIGTCCDDDTLPADSILHYRDMFIECAQTADRSVDTMETMRSRIEAAGFTNVQQQDFKVPLGAWPGQPIYKDAGRLGKQQYLAGIEGWTMFMLTHFGKPKPWSVEEVHVWLGKVRKEIDAGYHIYQRGRRVWAMKPLEDPKAEQKVELETVTKAT